MPPSGDFEDVFSYLGELELLFICPLALLLCDDTKSSSYTAASPGPFPEATEWAEGEFLSTFLSLTKEQVGDRTHTTLSTLTASVLHTFI